MVAVVVASTSALLLVVLFHSPHVRRVDEVAEHLFAVLTLETELGFWVFAGQSLISFVPESTIVNIVASVLEPAPSPNSVLRVVASIAYLTSSSIASIHSTTASCVVWPCAISLVVSLPVIQSGLSVIAWLNRILWL